MGHTTTRLNRPQADAVKKVIIDANMVIYGRCKAAGLWQTNSIQSITVHYCFCKRKSAIYLVLYLLGISLLFFDRPGVARAVLQTA